MLWRNSLGGRWNRTIMEREGLEGEQVMPHLYSLCNLNSKFLSVVQGCRPKPDTRRFFVPAATLIRAIICILEFFTPKIHPRI